MIDLPMLRYLLSQADVFGRALVLTLSLAMVACIGAVLWGAMLAFLRLSGSRWANGFAVAYIELFRNSPLLIQVYVIYFGLPMIGWPLSAFACACLALAAQHGAFLAEIFRAGIRSVGDEQRLAAAALALSPLQALRDVVLPQAMSRVVAPLGNQAIILVKDTSVVSAIGIAELTLTGKMLIERSAASFEVFAAIAVIYLSVGACLSGVFALLERRMRKRLK